MEIDLVKATEKDAEFIHQLQVESFHEIYLKYRDDETNPINESVEKIVQKLRRPDSHFYLIKFENDFVGGVRVIVKNNLKRISPLFVLPQYRNKGIAQAVMSKLEEIFGAKNWELETISTEEINRHLYEKMGYRSDGKTTVINDKLTLVSYRK
ncbi:MAG: GNAT family N-acetyltransferase [Alphaproteobacteria bacterium]|nr:GNAT family N-acetyltransferase [Alphaproteobacteria bacterium]MBO7642344.1 GNAT family N-acetyltransferase [Alphaproteobacteria bacterium]